MNGHYTDGGGYQPSDTVNPGVAVALRAVAASWRPR
jgi:hypothetical protein